MLMACHVTQNVCVDVYQCICFLPRRTVGKDVTGFQPDFKTHDVNPRHAVGYYVAGLRPARCGMMSRGTLRHGESLMPFRQIVDAGRVRRVSPYAITFMPFRQFVAALCHAETWRPSIAITTFEHRKYGVHPSQSQHSHITNMASIHRNHIIRTSKIWRPFIAITTFAHRKYGVHSSQSHHSHITNMASIHRNHIIRTSRIRHINIANMALVKRKVPRPNTWTRHRRIKSMTPCGDVCLPLF